MYNLGKSNTLKPLRMTLKNYLYYDMKCGSTHNRRCIDSRIAGCGNCVGYCQYTGHKGFLTKEQRKIHNCIEKGCVYYLPKIKRECSPKAMNTDSQKIVELATGQLSEYEGIRVMDAKKCSEGGWLLKYITLTNGYLIEALERKLTEVIGEPALIINLNCDFDRAAQLIFAQ